MRSELKPYTKEELEEQQRVFDEVFTPAWESEGQYCRAGGGQYEKTFAWWAFKHRQTEVDELQAKLTQAYEDIEPFAIAHEALSQKVDLDGALIQTQQAANKSLIVERDDLQKRVDAVKKLIQSYKDEEKDLEFKEWGHSAIYGSIAAELEQALKGEGND